MDGFKKFLFRGNIVELGVAIVLGVAFTALVGAFVAAFITPIVGVLTGSAHFRSSAFTIGDARFPYGEFVQQLFTFVATAAAVYFFVAKPVQAVLDRSSRDPDAEPLVRECPECLSSIPASARRCSFCTSVIAA